MKALIPLDGSDHASRITSTVRRLVALQPDIELHLVTVLDPKSIHGRTEHALVEAPAAGVGQVHVRTPLPRIVESHGEAMGRAATESKNWLEALGHREFADAAVTAHVAWHDHAAEGINALAEELDADLIVMAAHGRSGLSHLVAGSVTEAVIRTARRPVLVQGPGVS
jgi:nucleotide-binding universal stress UspA family protein